MGTSRLWQGSQSWNAEQVVRTAGGQTLRSTVKRDAYDDQSIAAVDMWTGKNWTTVLTRSFGELPAKEVSYVWDEGRARIPMMASLDVLHEAARRIVEGTV